VHDGLAFQKSLFYSGKFDLLTCPRHCLTTERHSTMRVGDRQAFNHELEDGSGISGINEISRSSVSYRADRDPTVVVENALLPSQTAPSPHHC